MIIQRMNDANIRLFLKDRKLTGKLHKLDFPCMLHFLSIRTSMCKCRQRITMFRIRIFQLTSILREREETLVVKQTIVYVYMIELTVKDHRLEQKLAITSNNYITRKYNHSAFYPPKLLANLILKNTILPIIFFYKEKTVDLELNR